MREKNNHSPLVVMSTVPKARKSTITNLTISPDAWDSYPEVEHSKINTCTFRNLNSKTRIYHSLLTDVTLEANSTSKGSVIEHSELHKSSVADSTVEHSRLDRCSASGANLEYCKMENCTLTAPNHLEYTTARSTNFVSIHHGERSTFEDTVVLGRSHIERSVIKGSVVADSSHCERSELEAVVITRSRTEKVKLRDCDVMDCEIIGTNFEGMILKYGIWKKGDLVGRTSKEDVVIKARVPSLISTAPPPLPPSSPAEPSTGLPREKESQGETDTVNTDSSTELSTPTDITPSSDGEEPTIQDLKLNRSHPDFENHPAFAQAEDNDPPPPYQR